MSEAPTQAEPSIASGWTYPGVIILETLLMAVAMGVDIALNHELGLISNIALVGIAIVGAWKVRRADYLAAIWAPVLAWFISLMTIGQMLPKRSTHFVREQALHLVYGLAQHAWWITGATLLAGIIAVVRRNRKTTS